MALIINNAIQNVGLCKKETGQTDPAEGRSKEGKSECRDANETQGSKDIVDLQNPLRHAIEANRASLETNVHDVEKAQKILHDVIERIHSENKGPRSARLYQFDQGNLVKLLT